MNRLPALVASAMLIVVMACKNEVESKQGDDPVLLAEASADPWAGEAVAATGHLKIQVPVGVVGEHRYWIYLNGRIVSAPQPKAGVDNDYYHAGSSNFMSTPLGGGWDFWDADGKFLSISHEVWTDSLDHYLKSGDPRHIFKLIDLTLPPGKYRVELVFLSDMFGYSSSFPFVISHPYDVEVQSEKVTEIYPGVPDSFEQSSPVRAIGYPPNGGLCFKSNPAPPNLTRLQNVISRFGADPVVKALEEASATYSPPEKVVSLNLPKEMGGLRTFDGTQISLIAQVPTYRYDLPTPKDVATCIGYFPQFSSSYDAYLKSIALVEKELESFRQLGTDLNGQ